MTPARISPPSGLARPVQRPSRRPSAKLRSVFGTCSWTDPTLLAEGVFYPPEASTPEARLRYYSSRFPVVEVDSSYYALPSRRNSEMWVERTPARFAFDIKAHALMTGQPSEVKRLPADLKKALPEGRR